MWDLTGVETTGGFEPLEAGTYDMTCVESTLKDTKAGTGQYVACTFEVVDGKYKGRKVWHNFNVSNPNEKAQQIGLGQLKAFLVAADVKPEMLKKIGPAHLTSLNCLVTLKVEVDGYGERNKVVGFKSKTAKTSTTSAKTQTTTQAQKAGF